MGNELTDLRQTLHEREHEVVNLGGELESQRRAMVVEKERSCWFEDRVKELERAVIEWENRSDEQTAKVREWEREESERRVRENMRKEIRQKVESGKG